MKYFEAIQIETIQGCNLSCWSCPNKDIPHTGELMAWELFTRLIGQLADMAYTGCVRPYLMNEAFTDERMPDMLRYIRHVLPGAKCVINTNGVLLSNDMAREMAALGVKLRISAYTLATLKRFKTARIPTTHVTNFTNTRENVPSFFTNRAGAVPMPGQSPVGGDCQYPNMQMYIRADGRAVLCCQDYYNAVVMGDANTTPLLDLFNNELYTSYRQALSRGQRRPPLCSQCSYRGFDD